MSKNIKTQEAKLDLITKFLDYANIADASYAMLQYVWENIEQDEKNNIYKADKLTFGDKLKQDIVMKNSKGEDIVKPKNTNTAYACAIQARFEQNKIVKIEPKYCISLINTCFDSKEITLDNDISRVGLNDALSKRTIDFVNRFKLLKHQPNTTSGFSATLFYDKQKDEFIVGFRGTEGFWNIDTMQDITLSLNGNIQSSSLLEFLEQVNKIVRGILKRTCNYP
ncbi:hypothetical protein [Campylobacter jejuni]|uniref:hypothetical protein n=1 Tax=Campylobacter jejuni TaxID=197 RepID=UPI000C2845FF|nr:hypothetical protein [Campylobacter jejuni]PJP47139.1 hypothetical protein CV377_08725 [Campylobacter jejuni subsp. jejuni]